MSEPIDFANPLGSYYAGIDPHLRPMENLEEFLAKVFYDLMFFAGDETRWEVVGPIVREARETFLMCLESDQVGCSIGGRPHHWWRERHEDRYEIVLRADSFDGPERVVENYPGTGGRVSISRWKLAKGALDAPGAAALVAKAMEFNRSLQWHSDQPVKLPRIGQGGPQPQALALEPPKPQQLHRPQLVRSQRLGPPTVLKLPYERRVGEGLVVLSANGFALVLDPRGESRTCVAGGEWEIDTGSYEGLRRLGWDKDGDHRVWFISG